MGNDGKKAGQFVFISMVFRVFILFVWIYFITMNALLIAATIGTTKKTRLGTSAPNLVFDIGIKRISSINITYPLQQHDCSDKFQYS